MGLSHNLEHKVLKELPSYYSLSFIPEYLCGILNLELLSQNTADKILHYINLYLSACSNLSTPKYYERTPRPITAAWTQQHCREFLNPYPVPYSSLNPKPLADIVCTLFRQSDSMENLSSTDHGSMNEGFLLQSLPTIATIQTALLSSKSNLRLSRWFHVR